MIECIERGDGFAVTLDYVKNHLRLETSDEDLYLEQLIRSATELCEKATQRTFITKTYKRLYLPRNEGDALRQIDLFYPPLISIQSVKRIFKNNHFEVVHRYMLSPNTYRPRITIWGEAIEIIYKAGYGDKPKDIPDSLRQAITLVAADMYEKRTDSIDVISKTVEMFLQPYRIKTCL